MLDTDTKRRIDTARDILVGKVPDPKSQVEQITIALIYKFMDDMDAQAEELGGKRTFFAGDFARFGWSKLMRSGLGGHETLNLYAEAITTMPENPGIPPLFRSIFNNAYLPYRDPETLKMFLKVIDEFEYDHSERLGDAFEYLLSVLGSQGEAGQFRTPRHIIDFMVEVVDPQKNEKVLDPACGTAGFLISSYKHILKNNKDKQGNSTLTPDERKKLADNFRGYDISPDMVRLSLVNMYLHSFTDPHIDEYDTLTSQDKWNEYADVILANPPFMSPKGGIKPHKRFSVQSKRSEVLFVDYMAEHLTPTGRAGIIVPEGIIFQSQNAYKQLRKMLVDEYLVAVVSLPAGVFNPYSGVKTSILILDKSLAKQSSTIGFFKVEHDGFNLGAQRRPIERNDLPQVKAAITEYLDTLRAKKPVEDLQPTGGLIVEKSRIAEGGDYNLSGERYRETIARSSSFPIERLGNVCEMLAGNTPSKANESYWRNGTVKWISSKHIDERGKVTGCEFISKSAVDDGKTKVAPASATIIVTRVSVGKYAFPDEDVAINQDLTALVPSDHERLEADYLRVLAPHIGAIVERTAVGIGVRGVKRELLANIQIPLPPLVVQKEIVAEIEGYQKIIDGARAVIDNYRPHIPIHPDWPMVDLGSLAENLDAQRVPIMKSDRRSGPYPYYGASGIIDYVHDFIFDEPLLLISEDGANLLARVTPIAFSVTGKSWVNNHAHVLRFPEPATRRFVEIHLNTISIDQYVTGSAQPKLNQKALNSIEIPIPVDVAAREPVVAEIEAEQALVEANREIIDRFEKKVQATIARIWGEEESVEPTAEDEG